MYTLTQLDVGWKAEGEGHEATGDTATLALLGLFVVVESERCNDPPHQVITIEQQGTRHWIASDGRTHVEGSSAYGALRSLQSTVPAAEHHD